MGHQARPKVVQHNAQRPAPATADHHRRAEHAAGAAAADRQPGGEDLAQRNHQQDRGGDVRVLHHRVLDRGIAER